MLSREGLTVDVVARLLSKTIFHALVSCLIACIAVSNPPAFSQFTHAIAERYPQYRLGAYVIAGASIAHWANLQLNKWTHNNWTLDRTWDFNKEIVLVTGGAGGIGESIIKQLLAKNRNTTIVVVDYIGLKWTPPAGSKVHYYQCDLSNSSHLKSMASRIKLEVGHPTVLVNNAGLCRGSTIMEGSYQDVELTIRTNLTAPFLLAKEFLPEMVKHDHGHIVNVSSLSSVFPPAQVADYAATKAGLTAMSEALQLELKNCHDAPRVRVSVGIFSFIRTPLFKGETRQSQFLTPLLHVDSVGEALADIIHSGYGKMLYMPGIMRYITMLRGGPEWMLRRAREKTSELGVIFNQPNQKIDSKTGYLLKE